MTKRRVTIKPRRETFTEEDMQNLVYSDGAPLSYLWLEKRKKPLPTAEDVCAGRVSLSDFMGISDERDD